MTDQSVKYFLHFSTFFCLISSKLYLIIDNNILIFRNNMITHHFLDTNNPSAKIIMASDSTIFIGWSNGTRYNASAVPTAAPARSAP